MSMNRDAVVQDTILTMATVNQERGQERQGQAPGKRSTTKPTWNTKDMGKRLGVDVASAATAGVLTCPLITIIDRAIMEKASKGFPIGQTINNCLRSMVARPSGFFFSTPFILIYTLYTSTYLTANAIDTLKSTTHNQPYNAIDTGLPKFFATTIVNMTICVYKDARFAKMFGASPSESPARNSTINTNLVARKYSSALRAPCPPSAPTAPTLQIPKVSYGLFCLRDSITIWASFNIPALIAPSIPDFLASSSTMKSSIAQFACPAVMQFASTPMHLLGLDLYNRQPTGGLRWTERVARIRRDYVPSCFARMGKIVPAYGVGGVVNVRMRDSLMKRVEMGE
ncbi:unnamed protein product [Penicillium nalgiovense]|uniref:Sequence orphan n=1 Tax=Penicillium nalgiovense TaxID=60175 RepID=A0A1V6Y0D1_PENNA|nr:hypothetical protein PENNAL_c0044G12013 [Penicillium nalgiovense]CAG8007871.1 unnamed protein product [Penicillium nalgiovense]CAG8104084.1 unnamed protein product [Penicillium nalgiovense]CAG8134774.1 unnamed protein product [Penicillium nalgiovense]CAG8149269.1 unnamed protein product [Penicillium nalgiovense]